MDAKELDAALVKEALDGSQKAYEKLFNKYRYSLRYSILQIVRDDETANDLLMESFSRAFLNLNRYTTDFAFSTWLFRIGVNCAIDYKRKHGRVVMCRIEQDDPDREDRPMLVIPDPDRTPADAAIQRQRVDLVRGVIAQLPEPFYTMVHLRYIDGFAYDEIADELDVPLGTVKASLHRAKQLLWERLAEDKRYKEILTEEI